MVRNLDRNGHGVVNWRDLATYIILLKSSLPNDRDLESFKRVFTQQTGGSELIDQSHFADVSSIYINPFRLSPGLMSLRTIRIGTTRSPSRVSPTSRTCFSASIVSTNYPQPRETRSVPPLIPSSLPSVLRPR